MFTLKFYRFDGSRTRILSADFITILRDGNLNAEITLHRNVGEDIRVDIGPEEERPDGWPAVYQRVIIENAAGKTTEIINAGPAYRAPAPVADEKKAA